MGNLHTELNRGEVLQRSVFAGEAALFVSRKNNINKINSKIGFDEDQGRGDVERNRQPRQQKNGCRSEGSREGTSRGGDYMGVRKLKAKHESTYV